MCSTRHALEYALVKAQAELKAEHSRYCLGYIWWLFEPVLQLLTLYVIFGIFLQREKEGYLAFLLVGIVVWKGVVSIIQHAAPAVMQHRDILMQTALTEWVFPLSAALADGVKIVGLFCVLLLFLWVHHGFHPQWLFSPVLLAILFIFAVGFGVLLASILPLLPDLRFVVDSLLQLGFWAAGVFFSAAELPEAIAPYFYLNPAACLLTAFRHVLLTGSFPDSYLVLYPLAWGAVSLILGLRIMHRFRGEYVKL